MIGKYVRYILSFSPRHRHPDHAHTLQASPTAETHTHTYIHAHIHAFASTDQKNNHLAQLATSFTSQRHLP